MYYALTIRDNLITGVHESAVEFTPKTFENNPRLSADEVRLIPARADYLTGVDIRCFEVNGTAKDPVWCIEQGYMALPEGWEIIDGVLVQSQVPEVEAPPRLLERLETLIASLENMRTSLLGRLQMLESIRAWSDIARGELVPVDTLVVFLWKRYRCIKKHRKTLLPVPANDPINWAEDVP